MRGAAFFASRNLRACVVAGTGGGALAAQQYNGRTASECIGLGQSQVRQPTGQVFPPIVGRDIKWGIIGPGGISNDFAIAMSTIPGAKLVAVGSRDLGRAEAFRQAFGADRAYGSYEALVNDPEIDVVYIGSPHTSHKEHALMALRAGKHVVCEKPVTLNEADARELHETAKQCSRFFLHGVWSRFFPSYSELKTTIREGALGEVRSVNVAFGFNNDEGQAPRLQLPELGGGALLDIGIYVIQLGSLCFGEQPPTSVHASGSKNQHGVDKTVGLVVTYPVGDDPKGGVLSAVISIGCELPNEANINGTKGAIKLHAPFWSPTSMSVTTDLHKRLYPPPPRVREGNSPWPSSPGRDGLDNKVHSLSPLPEVPSGMQLNFSNSMGFVYEIAAVMHALRNGQAECAECSSEESLRIMATLDECRKQLGVVYPHEK